MEKHKSKGKIIIISIIALLLTVLMVSIIYINIIKPKYYNNFIATANKYLKEEKYNEAIITFDKAIHIEKKSTQARLGKEKDI